MHGAGTAAEVIDALLLRGDAVTLSDGNDEWIVPVAPHLVSLAGETVELGCISARAACRKTRFVEDVGPPTYRHVAPTLTALALSAARANEEAADLAGWRALAARGAREDLLAWPSDGPPPPRQLARAAALFGHLTGSARDDALAELAAWAGLDETGDSDPSQDVVARAEPATRLLVEAGPGSGKTHTIATRVSSLVRAGLSPFRIHVVSFTRNAVAEMAARLARSGIGDDVDCTTLDQLAGRLLARFGDGSPRRGYDATIEGALALLVRDDERVLEWLGRREHLVVDEAQDVVGIRRDFILALMDRLAPGCGITVACDPHQAIYGHRGEGETLAERCRAKGFAVMALARNHRAGSARLRAFASEGRQILASADAATVVAEMTELLVSTAEGTPTIPETRGARRFADLSLFRIGNAMAAFACRLTAEGIPFALRGGRDGASEPPLGPAWIGAVACAIDGRKPTALEAALAPLAALDPSTPTPDDAQAILRPALDGGVYTERGLARALEAGRLGVLPSRPGTLVLSTVHAAKGLEADNVAVYLPAPRDGGDDDRDDPFEEARILYVAGTRARMRLKVGEEPSPWRRVGQRHVRPQNRSLVVQLTSADCRETELHPGVDPVRLAGIPPVGPVRLVREDGRWRIVARIAGDERPIAALPASFGRDVRRAVTESTRADAFPGSTAYFSGTLRIASLARDDGVDVVPVLEGFARIPVVEASR